MGYTGTIPYTAQEFVPGQKALAQDITNISYALSRLDTNAANAYCVKQKLLSTDDQVVASLASTSIRLKNIAADPLGMSTSDTDFTIPFDGIWTVSGYFSTQEAGNLDGGSGCWFRLNNVDGNGNLISATTAPTGSISTSVTLPFVAGDVLTPYFYNRDDNETARVWTAACSVVLVH